MKKLELEKLLEELEMIGKIEKSYHNKIFEMKIYTNREGKIFYKTETENLYEMSYKGGN